MNNHTEPGVGMHPDGHEYYLVQDDLLRWTDADVQAAEAGLGRSLPPGYREFVTSLGTGAFNDFLRLPTVTQLVEQQKQFQEFIQAAWFFEGDLLTQDRASESVQVADSMDGDLVVFDPASDQYFVLPRHDDRIYAVGGDMAAVVGWFLESGVLLRPSRVRYFESFRGPIEAANGACSRDAFSGASGSLRSLHLHNTEDQTEDGATFFVKALGGLITFQIGDGPEVYVHLRYRTDLHPELRERITSAATAAGVTFYPPWQMAPAPSA